MHAHRQSSRVPHLIKLDSRQMGLRRILGELEHAIMQILWERGKATVREAHTELKRQRKVAYTTVMTVMSRLAEKGLLETVDKVGNAFVYRPAASPQELTRLTLGRVFTGLVRDWSGPAIHQFVEALDRECPEELEELERAIEDQRRRRRHG